VSEKNPHYDVYQSMIRTLSVITQALVEADVPVEEYRELV